MDIKFHPGTSVCDSCKVKFEVYCICSVFYIWYYIHKENHPVKVINSGCGTAIEFWSMFLEKCLYKEVNKINPRIKDIPDMLDITDDIINNNNNNNNNITRKPRTTISTVNKNQIYSIYPLSIFFILFFLNKFSEDTVSIFKFSPLTLWHKNGWKIFWYFTNWYN